LGGLFAPRLAGWSDLLVVLTRPKHVLSCRRTVADVIQAGVACSHLYILEKLREDGSVTEVQAAAKEKNIPITYTGSSNKEWL
jgi:hypothetical protein